MKRNFLFILAIALAVPYMTALAGGDAFDPQPDQRQATRPADAERGAGADCRELCTATAGGPTHEEWPQKNIARLPDDKNNFNQDERRWQYDQE